MTAIKPCPFCGSDDTAVRGNWWVQCSACWAYGPAKYSEDTAIEAWNSVKRGAVKTSITVTNGTADKVSKLLRIAAEGMEQWEKGNRGLSFTFPIMYAHVSEATISRPSNHTVNINFEEQTW